MGEECLSYKMLLEKSKERKFLFSNLLGGAVLEEVVRRIAESEDGEKLWLRNGNILGQKQYEKKLTLNLEYNYIGLKTAEEGRMSELAKRLKEEVFERTFDYGIMFSVEYIILNKYLSLRIFAKVEDMQVPVSVKIYPFCHEKKIPKKESFSCMMFPETAVCYNCHPTEEILAEKFAEIVTALELIRDMRAYYDVYCLLDKEPIDGRKVRECISEVCKQYHISREKNPIETIAGYRNYTFMKKKWKRFLRSINSREPSWEMTAERFVKFFDPMWQAVIGDFVFFGDWMPELERFL